MSQYLPIKGFRWLTQLDIRKLNINDLAEDGFIYEVDLRYPTTLHTPHNSYPLAPERRTIEESMLSPLQNKSTTKLAPNLMEKRNYVVHYRNLKFSTTRDNYHKNTSYSYLKAIAVAQSIH